MAIYDIHWQAPLVVGTTVDAGQAVLPKPDGEWVVATAANRALYGRTAGIVLVGASSESPAPVAVTGIVDKTITGLGTGTASWVRVDANGTLERCTPSGSDDVVGYCRADGTLHVMCNFFTAAMINATGPAVPTGTGFRHVTSGSEDAAAAKVDLTAAADVTVPASGVVKSNGTVLSSSNVNLTSEVTGTLPVANGGTGLSAVGAAYQLLRTNAGATAIEWGATNLASSNAVTGALPYTNGGTGLTALGSPLQVLRTNAGATAMEWATISSASVAGSNTQVQFNDGGAFGADADFTWDKSNNRLAVTGGVSMGSTVASTGTQRVADGFTLYGRNDTNSGNIPIIDFSGNALSYGDATVEGMTHNVGAAYSHAFQVNSLPKLTVSSSATTCQSTVFTCNDVTIGSTYVQIGATTASTGGLRVGDGWTAYGRNSGAGNSYLFNWYATSDALFIGETSGGASQVTSTVVNSATNVYLASNGTERVHVTTSEISTALPLAGYSGGSQPFRLKVATKSFSDLTDYTLVPSEYSCPIQRYSDSGGGPGSGTKNIIGPTTDGAIFFVDNRMSATNVTFKTAAGSGPTISNTNGRALVYCDGTNYVLLNDIVA